MNTRIKTAHPSLPIASDVPVTMKEKLMNVLDDRAWTEGRIPDTTLLQ
jgi:hypothetical protein